MYAIKHFEFFLIGRNFNAVVDHKSLLYLFKEHLKTKLNVRLINSFYYLQQFDFKLIHKPGSSETMASADAFSRLPAISLEDDPELLEQIPDRLFAISHLPKVAEESINSEDQDLLKQLTGLDSLEMKTNSDVPPFLQFHDYNIGKKDLIKLQMECRFCSNQINKLSLKSKRLVKNFLLLDGILYRKTSKGQKIVLPNVLSNEFLSFVHHMYLHPGTKKLIQIVTKFVFVPDLVNKCKTISKNCLTCIRNKPVKMLIPSKIERHPFEAVPFNKSAIDLYDLGITDSNNKRYLLVIIDHLTNFIDGEPLSSKTDSQVTNALTKLFLRHGVSGTVISDNGREFDNTLVKDLMQAFNIRHSLTSAYASRSNGKVERVNREIHIKQKLLGANRRNWSYLWPFIQFSINNTPSEALNNLSSSEAYFGRSLFNPISIKEIKTNSYVGWTEAISNYLNELLPSIGKFQLDRQNKFVSSQKGNAPKLAVGDRVLIWMPRIDEGKLSRMWHGPLKVVRHYSASSYVLMDEATGTKYKRSIRQIRPLGKLLNRHLELEAKSKPEFLNESENDDNSVSTHDFKLLPFADT